MRLIDISLPIYNNMWSYKPQWQNSVEVFESTVKGGASTVYKLNVFSHTGTYIETSSHKLKSELLLSALPRETFYRKVKLIITGEKNTITKNGVMEAAGECGLTLEKGDAVIIANGYGMNHRKDNYLSASPSFDPELTDWLCQLELSLLGVDTPIIENITDPSQPVVKLFTANPQLLLLAPLHIDTNKVAGREYLLSCMPLNVEGATGMLCSPFLIEN